jgi:hypothetical protein
MAIVSLGRHGNGAAQDREVKKPPLVLHIELGRRAMYQAGIVPHHLSASHGAAVFLLKILSLPWGLSLQYESVIAHI